MSDGLRSVSQAGAAALLVDQLVERVAGRVAELVAEQLRPPAAPPSPWLNVDEAAEYLRCAPKRIYDLVSQGRLPAHRDGKRLLFRREELDEYLFTTSTTNHRSTDGDAPR